MKLAAMFKAQSAKIKVQRFEYAFTLIELLVVISIIALLATLFLANFNATRSRARDAQRKADLKNIQTALKLYENDYDAYPNNTSDPNWEIQGCGASGTSTCSWRTNFIANNVTYMSILPGDPSPDRNYRYDRDDVQTDFYTLKACLENVSDEKCGTDEPWCASPDGCVYTVQP